MEAVSREHRPQAIESRAPVRWSIGGENPSQYSSRAFQDQHQVEQVSKLWPCQPCQEKKPVWRGSPRWSVWSVWSCCRWGGRPDWQSLMGQQKREAEQSGGGKGKAPAMERSESHRRWENCPRPENPRWKADETEENPILRLTILLQLNSLSSTMSVDPITTSRLLKTLWWST